MPSPVIPMLARAFLAGTPDADRLHASAVQLFGQSFRWIRPLAARYARHFAGGTTPRLRHVEQFLRNDRSLHRALSGSRDKLHIQHWIIPAPAMLPVESAESWAIPILETPAALAAWLQISITELDWFADRRSLLVHDVDPRLRHYCYHVTEKRSGAVRLIESPKPRLKQIQRRILTGILDRIPPHPCAHGFVKGRSIRTFVTLHTGRSVVLRMDVQDFFPSFTRARIQGFFRTAGYPEPVADLLGSLCTNITPPGIAAEIYTRAHLPQGAPTSPALANVCSYRIDCRLAGLARCAGADYARYADDLAFSGDADFERRVERFSTHVAAVLLEEGFSVHHRKTRIMRQGVRQHLTGLVTNAHPNVMRPDYDLLKAILTNCIRHGPASQNRENHADYRAHLMGRVGFVESINPARGARLRGLYDRIQW